MRSLLALILLASSTAFAGDGGFSSISCVSESGRTVLSVLNSNSSGSAQPTTVRLIIDGQMAEYKSSAEIYDELKDAWVPADVNAPSILVTENDIFVTKNDKELLRVAVKLTYSNKKYTATIYEGYTDPRKGTDFESYISSNGAITLNCKEYYQGP